LCLERAPGLNYDSQLRTEFLEKRNFLLEALRVGGFKPHLPDGAYYIVADASSLTGDPMAFSRWMVETAGLAAMPSSVFYIPEHEHLAPPSFRFAFCKSELVLEAAAKKLSKLQRLL
jgi:N-succinyldiaminopimelate aminotransferase